ncbi:MAG: LacI family transcriptional regulator [Glaciihabitans sp.]|jgi:transcriptional regulator with XRE-family HTH domain|nr:LacI family transcriptional regulator [Glaciihabitans sp.]
MGQQGESDADPIARAVTILSEILAGEPDGTQLVISRSRGGSPELSFARPRDPRRKVVTIRSVAEAAGVSIGTVSNVLNGSVRVAEETRDRVTRAVEALGFERNVAARQLGAHRAQAS